MVEVLWYKPEGLRFESRYQLFQFTCSIQPLYNPVFTQPLTEMSMKYFPG
jgi:hypothetical protein